MPGSVKYWLFKSEPNEFSIRDLAQAPDQTTCWDGVRNYQARNMLRDQVHVGDRVLFYHSSVEPTAVVGTAVVVRGGYPDHTAWDRKSVHFDAKSSPNNPVWYMVDIQLDCVFPRPVTLAELRMVKGLAKMELLRKGSRLSIQPVTQSEFESIVRLGQGRAK